MKQEAYDFVASEDALRFTFESVGPMGRIVKVVLFEQFEDDPNMHNLGFGDWDGNQLNDMTISGNGDREMILATVLLIVEMFFVERPTKLVYFTGSSRQRNRIYNWLINRYLGFFERKYRIFGVKNWNAYPFERGDSYSEFVVMKKENPLYSI